VYRTLALAIVVALAAGAPSALTQDRVAGNARPIDQHALFRAVGAMYGIDPALLEAIARAESGGNPSAVSPKGACGLMQLMPDTAARFGVLDPMDPVENALGAARFIAYLRAREPSMPEETRHHLPEILAAYNAGEGAVDKYGGIPPYSETQGYVRAVLIDYLLDGDPANVAPLKPTLSSDSLKAAGAKSGDDTVMEHLARLRRARQHARTASVPAQ